MKILRINTRTKSFKFEELGDLAGLGGRALTSRVVNKEVPAELSRRFPPTTSWFSPAACWLRPTPPTPDVSRSAPSLP
jgi:hypothetical protein